MAKKPEPIVRLAAQTARQIFANSGNYMAFLTTAAHNFKYSFRDQLLIYAQKPDATACAQTDFWNKHGRWVNKGTTGIALLVDTDKGYKLRHVFDMSDTNSRAGRTVPVWQMRPQYEGPVVEALENSYGEFSDKADFAECLMETAKIIVEDNFGDYYADLCRVKEGSLLEELDDLNTEVWFKRLLENSVAYIMLTRCGLDPQEYFSGEDFARVFDFNTLETLSILGGAVSDISEMPLREIASTVLPLYWEEEKQNRTFAGNPDRQYNDGRVKRERSVGHGTDVPNGERLPPAQPGRAGGTEGRKIWDAAAQLPQKPQERLLHGDASQRQTGRPSGEDRPGGHRDGGTADSADGAGAGRDGGTESVRSDEVGGPDEQHPGSGGGSNAGGADLHRRVSDPLPTEEEQKAAIQAAEDEQSSAFAISQEDIDAILLHGSGIADGKFRIFEQFETAHSSTENTSFLKEEYKSTAYFTVSTDKKIRAWFDRSGVKISIGDLSKPDAEVTLTWKKAAKRIGQLVEAGRYLSPAEKEKYLEYQRQESVPGPVAATPEPEHDELNPPPAPPKEYRLTLGATVYLGAQGYELLAFDEQTVRLFDPAFPIINKELPRKEFDRLLAENPMNDGLLQEMEDVLPAEPAEPDTPGYDLGFGHLGSGVTVWNRLELRYGDYKTIAHIAPDRTVTYYEDGLPEDVRAQIEEFAATSTMTISATQDAPVFSTPPLVREPAVAPAEAGEPTYPPRELPYIFCEWSESVVFQDKTAYSLQEFDRLMKQADDEYIAGRTAAMAKYGTWQKWYDANDPEYNAFLGYDKVKFTLVMPDGRTFSERQDIGDGDGGVLDFLNQYDKYREIVPVLREAVRKEEEAAQSGPVPQPELASGRFWDAYNSIKEHNPDSLVLYQVGDFFELYGGLEGEDARSAAVALDLTLTIRNIPEYGRVSMCGFPAHKLEDYVKRLNGKGFDVVVAALEHNRHVPVVFPAQPSEKAEQKADNFSDIDPAADTPPAPERFSLIETERGYAVWDDVQGGIYVDSEGVQEEFTSEWQAEDYLKQIKQAEAERSAGSSADGRSSNRDIPSPQTQPRRYQVVVYHHIENGMDEKREYETLQEAEKVARGYVDGTLEDDGFAYEGAAVYDLLERKWLSVIGNFPVPETPAEKEEVLPPSTAQHKGVKKVAEYLFDQERIVIFQYPNGQFYNHYGYDEQRGFSNVTAGGFDTFEEAEKALYSHRPKAETVLEPAEKAADTEKSTESLADGHGHDGEGPVQPPPVPRRRAKVSPFVLHPEVPDADRHEYRITDDAIGVGTPGTRFNNNIRAIRLLKKLEREDRFATPEEQEVLAQYVGWGGLADCFDERHSKYAELKALLDEDEYAAARESTLTAFYTPPVVIRSIYQALENMGFKTGNLLEPSCGIGNFIGMRPDSLADSKIYGIELDGISGRIAQQLYQKSSIAVQGFETTELPDSFFDAAIGNVPFGALKVTDKRYDKHNFFIHDYFFARTLDKVRPGGIIAFVTSKGTMDKENPNVRKYIAQRADLLGAIRLPNNTFKAAAGTEVTSDILFLQKREALASGEPDWVHLNTDENGLKMNQYFIDHPEMVMGEMREVSGPHGPETACLTREGQNLGEQLAAAIQNIQGTITEYVMDDPEAEGEDKSIPADPNVRNFSYTVVDGEIYYRENSRMNPVEVSVTAANRIKGLIEIRECVRTLIDYQTEDWPAEDIQAEQKKLNDLYDTYVEKYGRINSRGNSIAFRMDSAYFLLASLEVLDDERNFVRKADMFTKRTIKQKTVITSVDTSSEALAVSLAERACVDLGFMASLMGGGDKIPQVVEDLKGIIFKDPLTGSFDIEDGGTDWYKGWQTADEYLSGNVREKLADARRAAETDPAFQVNVEALEQVQPTDLNASEISVRLGSTWLPPDVVDQFVFELLDTSANCQEKIHVHFSRYTGAWNVEGKSVDRVNVKANSTYGTTRINAYKIIEDTLNLRDVRIFDYVQDRDGKKVAVLNKKETAIAQGKQELIKQAFQDWIWKDPARRERLTTLYNVQFNSLRPREYDGSHISFVGMNPEITLRKHQRDAIARILYGGNTLLGHVVGAGKTWEMAAAAQESKRLGLCQKSLFVVPNHLTEQWAAEYLQLYPSANILVATKKDFETKNRKRFCGRIATGDYDAIIIGHSQFEKIPMSIERQRFTLEQQLDEIALGIAELKAQKGENFSVKQLAKTRKDIREKLARLNNQSRKDDVVTFEELGVDRIFIDEAHYYKNLASFSKMRNVGGISQTEAQKSSDLYMKCRYLDELTEGRGVIFATGTPISNTMVELYTMQKYLQYETLRRQGLLHFDAWASTFGETVTAIELAPEGTGYRAKTRFARFHNLPELMAMFKEVADIQTADMLNLPVPKAVYHTISLKPSELQRQMVAALAERAEKVRNREVRSDQDNMLLITNDGRKLALDQRLTNPLLPDSETSKVNACADNVFEIWQNTADQRSAQMIFCDLSTPGKERPIEMAETEPGAFEMASFQNLYDDLCDKLIAKGIPTEEIAYVHSANTEAKKKELFGKVRSGQIRVLIGSTQKMGAGTNVQHKLIALHHLDCPWRPSDDGRTLRTHIKAETPVRVSPLFSRKDVRSYFVSVGYLD